MVDINKEQFMGMEQGKKEELLFDNICGTETALRELTNKVDALLKSPWRMAVPPVSWKSIAVFVLALAAILKGDVGAFGKLLGAVIGIG
jgi:hypothetical protein